MYEVDDIEAIFSLFVGVVNRKIEPLGIATCVKVILEDEIILSGGNLPIKKCLPGTQRTNSLIIQNLRTGVLSFHHDRAMLVGARMDE